MTQSLARGPAARLRFGLAATLLLSMASPARLLGAQIGPAIPEEDRVRLAEAFRLGRQVEEDVWPGWGAAPFAVLLVTAETEFLMRHPHPDSTFKPAGYDSLLASEIYTRHRLFQPDLLATFPFDGVPTIVMGEPGATGRPSSQWVITFLHEHFHQLQMSSPGYPSAVVSLGLAHGDESGQWMLNYPFPYDSPPVDDAFADLSKALLAALDESEEDSLPGKVAAYAEQRRDFARLVSGEEDRYFSFQVWQEGIARYVEYQIAKQATVSFTPSPELRGLPDFVPFSQVVAALRDDIWQHLQEPDLHGDRRLGFYVLGAGTGLLLDRLAPDWKKEYFVKRFQLLEQF
jgi:hypothetical protein